MSEDPEAHFHTPSFCEVLSRLAHEIRESRKASAAQLAWLQSQANSEQLNKRLAELRASIESAITRAKDEIMATEAQLTADLKAVLSQQQKTSVEIAALQASVDVLNEKIVNLEAVVANEEASPELTAAVAEVKSQAQAVDDQIPDAPAPSGRPS